MSKEYFKNIKGFEGIYQVSNLGNIKSFKKEIPVLLKLNKNSNGYIQAQLYLNGKRSVPQVHRLVAEAFIPNPENKPEVNHIDTIKTNNEFSNLEWVTRQENQIHISNITKIKRMKPASIEQLETTDKVYKLREQDGNDNDLCALIGISKVTLYTRLKKSNWKKSEIAHISNLCK